MAPHMADTALHTALGICHDCMQPCRAECMEGMCCRCGNCCCKHDRTASLYHTSGRKLSGRSCCAALAWQQLHLHHACQDQLQSATPLQWYIFSMRYTTNRQADRRTDRHTDRQAGRQAGRQTDRQTDRRTDRQTDMVVIDMPVMLQ